MTAKEILAKIKAVFAEVGGTPPAPAAPATPPPPVATTNDKTYKLVDGTEIIVKQVGDVPAPGDAVLVNGVPAGQGELILEDNSTLVVDAAGLITEIKPAAPVTQSTPDQNIPPASVQMAAQNAKTDEELLAMCTSFATGTAEDRIANLEVVAKAVMEYCFGWKIREAQQKVTEDQAINIYRNDLTTAQATMAAQEKTINRHEETIKGLFELVEKLVELPTEEPKTLTGNKKEQFERAVKKEKYFEDIAASLKKIKTEK